MNAVTFRQTKDGACVDFTQLIELAKKLYKKGEISIEIDDYEPNDETIKAIKSSEGSFYASYEDFKNEMKK